MILNHIKKNFQLKYEGTFFILFNPTLIYCINKKCTDGNYFISLFSDSVNSP